MNYLNRIDLLNSEPYEIIYMMLRSGAENAVPVRNFCNATELSDRLLRLHVERMRDSGIPILSCKNGYYLPADEDELKQYIAKMEKTARSYFKSLRSARKALKEMQTANQMKIPGA